LALESNSNTYKQSKKTKIIKNPNIITVHIWNQFRFVHLQFFKKMALASF